MHIINLQRKSIMPVVFININQRKQVDDNIIKTYEIL